MNAPQLIPAPPIDAEMRQLVCRAVERHVDVVVRVGKGKGKSFCFIGTSALSGAGAIRISGLFFRPATRGIRKNTTIYDDLIHPMYNGSDFAQILRQRHEIGQASSDILSPPPCLNGGLIQHHNGSVYSRVI
jgi:hypothetical protein